MKTAAEKSSSTSLLQRSQQSPFFGKRGEDSFFAASGVQASIEIGQPGDPYEQEADAMAEQVMRQDKETVQTKPLAQGITPIVRRQPEEQPGSDNLSGLSPEPVQMQAEAAVPAATVSPSVESQLQSAKGGGAPLPSKTREEMETGFGTDFGGVRVHTDSEAARMNKELGAQAFTHGGDVYFNDGKYQPESAEGKRLLAHELTHTVQQGGGVQRKVVQREGDPTGNQTFTSQQGRGVIERASNTYTIRVAKMKLPDYKVPFTSVPFTLPREERENLQISDWENQFEGSASINRHVQDKVGEAPRPIVPGATEPVYAFRVRGTTADRTNYIIGNADSIRQRILRPYWGPDGRVRTYHVDHKHEFQLGGADRAIENLWLLEAEANVDSGRKIRDEKYRRIQELIDEARSAGNMWRRNGPPTAQAAKASNRYTICFEGKEGGLRPRGNPSNNPNLKYTAQEIRQGKPLEGLVPLTEGQISAMGLNDSNTVILFTNRSGGKMHRIQYPTRQGGAKDINLGLGINIRATRVNITKNEQDQVLEGSTITGDVFRTQTGSSRRRFIRDFEYTFPVKQMPGLPNAGYIDASALRNQFQNELEFLGLSPIQLAQASLEEEKGFVARGQVIPSVPFLQNANIDLVIDGNDVYLEKVFSADQINVPAPFNITDSGLFVRVGTVGLEVGGSVNFEIDRVGQGSIVGGYSTSRGVFVTGNFDFDTQLFSRARVGIEYENGRFKVEGDIGIDQGKVRGIKQADAHVEYSEGTLTATGNAELDIKGLQRGTMSLRYTQNELTIGGTFQLSNEIPRIRSGEVSVTVTKNEEGYSVAASGTAVPDIPGIDASISVNYDNGALTVEGSVDYARGIASGRVRVGATNRDTPTGPPGDRWIVYGEGDLSLRLTPWLQATAGVRFSPTGELTVVGRIGLPGTVSVFDRKDFNKRLLNFPTVEIPLLAIPVGPRSVGLVATIGGGIDFNAGIGPGRLEELFGEVSYTVGQDDSLALHGRGKFVIPADATVRIFGRLGIGLSIGIARVTGNVELGAAVGIQGAAEAEVDVNWDPVNGLSLDAVGRIYVEPVLRLDVSLVAEAVLDLYFYEFRKEWRKTLAQKEFGSGLRYGLEFPVHYQEGQPFDISPEDLRVIQPEIDIGTAARQFGRELFA